MPESTAELRLLLFALLKDVHPQKLPGLLETYVALTRSIAGGDESLLPRQRALFEHLYERVIGLDLAQIARDLEFWERDGVHFVTFLDDEYPANLRHVTEAPPAIFVRGRVEARDQYSVAVVGTREASAEGLERAARMAAALATAGVTIVSGLAKGIDTAAHSAAMDVGGRTIAVMGTGHDTIYPAENRDLASRIATSGALVSQFPPRSPVRPFNFANRNWVTSGLAQGTIVIEASETSGAKLQAHNAVRQAKKVFLVRSLVESQKWARQMLDQGDAIEVRQPDDVLRTLSLVPDGAVAQTI
jgi:DNA processing protein